MKWPTLEIVKKNQFDCLYRRFMLAFVPQLKLIVNVNTLNKDVYWLLLKASLNFFGRVSECFLYFTEFVFYATHLSLSHAAVEMEDEDGTCLLDVLW